MRIKIKDKSTNFMKDIHERTMCLVCCKDNAIVVFEPKYNGLRGICLECDGNWPES